jgi:hypothetical protein
MAAPQATRGDRYSDELVERILRAAFAGFRAAVLASGKVTVHKGFWGCGAFGGDRRVMTATQILAPGAAGVEELVFWIATPGFLEHRALGFEIAKELAGFEAKEAAQKLAAKGLAFGQGGMEAEDFNPRQEPSESCPLQTFPAFIRTIYYQAECSADKIPRLLKVPEIDQIPALPR